MSHGRAEPLRWVKIGCAVVIGVGAVALLGLGSAVGLAYMQIDGETLESHRLEASRPASPTPAPAGSGPIAEAVPPAGRLELEVSVAEVVILPAPSGEPLRLEADYDPRRFELQHDTEKRTDGTRVYRVRFGPKGSRFFALFKAKMGGTISRLRITLPRDVRFDLRGRIDGAYAAIELGGLRIVDVDLEVEGAAVEVSFWEPLGEPMRSLSIVGSKGSLEVTALGNASPRSAVFEQRLGELDLDLRGAWLRDADIRVASEIGGGSVWLPDNVTVEGVEGRRKSRPLPASELPRPTLRLAVDSGGPYLLFVE